MGWEILPIVNGLGPWAASWDVLNQRLYAGHPFRDSRFVDAMLRYFGTGKECLCVHRSLGQIDGMTLLYPRLPGIWTQFVPAHAQSAPILIGNLDSLRDLFAALSPWAGAIEFMCQDPKFVAAALFSGKIAAVRIANHALTMDVDLSGGFDDYWCARPKKLVQNMRRYRRRVVEQRTSVELREIATPHMMLAAVERYGNLEIAGWKGSAGTAVHIDNIQGQFYAEILTRFAETGQAKVVEYWIGEQLAASRLIISGGGMSLMLKTTYNETLSSFAPGRLLLHDYLQRAFAEKHCEVIEFYTDATQDQLAWATGRRYIQHIVVFRNPLLARLYDGYQWLKKAGSVCRLSGARAWMAAQL